ncbi:hypothetical protein GALMADRAFT_240307 [Galerina marginata CBS 339.88]|uniref:Glyoxalase-like domain-containing protein n=1 Tax=Galerina marginata (strain CBS 339.88) TaxID=685588 RepID=A0A067TQ05_GALM3|nr:hypothetical protein GALMADRAFT_240307 [Galerina marginata CBS 339.88]
MVYISSETEYPAKMTLNTRTLDHIVHLTPPGSVEEASRQFRDLGFQVLPGGTHAGGLTANALVVFDDGVYLELISFTHPASYYPPGSPERKLRDTHTWAQKSPGWIDFAFLGNGSHKESESISKTINERGRQDGSGVLYDPEQDGGRTRPDGQILKWLISGPQSDRRGVLPFFCGDVTPRSLRVPGEPPSNTVHPSAARGIAYVRVLANASSFDAVSRQLTSVIGKKSISSTDNQVVWELDTVHKQHESPLLRLEVPADEEEDGFLQTSSSGIYEVAFRIKGEKRASQTTPYGKVSWVPIESN